MFLADLSLQCHCWHVLFFSCIHFVSAFDLRTPVVSATFYLRLFTFKVLNYEFTVYWFVVCVTFV